MILSPLTVNARKLYDARQTLAPFDLTYSLHAKTALDRLWKVRSLQSSRCSETERTWMEGHMKLFNAFLEDESGAVTVDWVVLTAAIVGLGIAVMTTVGAGTTAYADKISSHLANRSVTTTY